MYISDQVECFQKEKDEYLYFLSPDDPQVYNLEEQLVTSHTQKLREGLCQDEKNVPGVLVEYAVEMFDDNLRDILNENKRELKGSKDVQDFVDDWAKFVNTMLESIFEGKVKYWDESILDSDCDLVANFLNLFLYCQDILNGKVR